MRFLQQGVSVCRNFDAMGHTGAEAVVMPVESAGIC